MTDNRSSVRLLLQAVAAWSFITGLSLTKAAETPVGDSYEAWRRHSSAVLKDPDIVRYYTFENLNGTDALVPNLVGNAGTLKMGVAGGASSPRSPLPLVPGRWPQKKAVRLDREFLAGEPFDVTQQGFTLSAWYRTSGPGSIRGNPVALGGMLFSAGTGYWDGFRLTFQYPEKILGFEIGRPKPSSSVGLRTDPQADRVWRHLAATWDGRAMRVYADGWLAGETAFAGPFTPPGQGAGFRIGFANSGWGSAILEVDEVAIFRRAFSAAEVLQEAHFSTPLSKPVAASLAAARAKTVGRDFTAASAEYEQLLHAAELPADLAASARLGLAIVRLGQNQPSAACAELTRVVEMPGVVAGDRKTALGLLLRLVREAGATPPASVLQTLLAQPDLSPRDRMQIQFCLARQNRDAGKLAAAMEQYAKLAAMSELAPREQCEVRLELANTCFGARQYAAARAEYARLVDAPGVPAPYPFLAQLQIAASRVREKDYAGARREYAKLEAMAGVPRHLRLEAQECLRELPRLEAGLAARDPAWSRIQLPRRPAPAAEFYVAPDGSDANPGTRERPFASLERGRDAIRQLKARGELAHGGVAVCLRGGQYPRKATFRLTAEDSGTPQAPIVYRSVTGETPVLDGGVRLTGFGPVRDPAVLERLPESSRQQVLQVDVKAQGIRDLGEMRPRGYGQSCCPVVELFFHGKPMPLARWPNQGFVHTGKVLDPGEKGKPAVFEYQEDRPAQWTHARDAWLYGYWQHYWADGSFPIASVNPQSRQITLSAAHGYGIRPGMPYLALNLLEELDEPGEWYLDRATGILYFYPPAAPGERGRTANADIRLSLLSSPMVELDGVSHVTLQGLVCESGRSSGVIIHGGRNCLVAGCTLRRLGGDGVVIDGGSSHGILSCDIHTLGRGGTRLQGGDRKTLTPSGHFVENCHIYDFSRIDRTYTPAVWTDGVGTRIAHNLYHDSPGHGMRLEGNEHMVQMNEAYHVVWESDDQAAMEMFGDPTYRGIIFRHNFYHDIANRFDRPCGQSGIRLDDGICGVLIYGNVFYRCSNTLFGGVQIHGGKENHVDNNLFIDCKYAVSFSPWGQKRWDAFLAAARAPGSRRAVDLSVPPYSTRYPELSHLAENADVNAVWRNLVCQCGQFLTRDRGIQDVASNSVIAADPGFADAKKLDFRLPPQSAALDRAGMRPIPFDEIGLYEDEFRPKEQKQKIHHE